MNYIALIVLLTFVSTVWCADPKVVLRYTFPKTVIRSNYKTVVVEKDSDCFLACIVDNKPADKKVQWLVQNFRTNTPIPISTDTDTQNAFKYQIDKPAANNWRLKIQNAQESDQALYICRVQLGGQQNANDSRMIQVIQKPQIIDIFTSSNTIKKEGDPLELTCDASGIPKPVISWTMVGGGVLPTGGRELTAPSIKVDSVDRDMKGAYKCKAENIAGTDIRSIYLNVQFQPQVRAKEEVVAQAVGYSRELTCLAAGNPVPDESQMYWSRDGVPLDDRNKYAEEYYFGSNYVLMKLIIQDITENDFGQYRCYAENIEGNENAFVELQQSSSQVIERPGMSGSSMLTFSITTITMLVVTVLLHCC
ncbi:protein amalgam-like [Ruditapes philippinarum]|uniref:protein amalgam-like n=1 Tax=Ruditapes philippinarum TaxID=129788 RepID=UPI00295BD751|nr:protein amalgam-like [Ruditapes philippinarum]